jgi:hypothetical protein
MTAAAATVMLIAPAGAGDPVGAVEDAMASRTGTVWVEAGAEQLRAGRINEVSAAVAGQLLLRVAGHREPVVIVLVGIEDPQRTADFAKRLLALIEKHSQPRAASVVISYQGARDGFAPYWKVIALPGLQEVSRPPVDRAALPDEDLSADQIERLAGFARDRQERETSN